MNRIVCAIYTRKSSDEGLEQEFNSLDAQREASEAYIHSQKHEGWVVSPERYDDGGLSGGTIERPALQRLLEDIRQGKVQTIVVYKVDRLTRSLPDFAKIVDILDTAGASFVSVTQQFNTTTSMGRLTLNMLLSFAQFEREIAGERIRDKIKASKAKGMWMGGTIPLGYDVKDRKLVINQAEAATVRTIFSRYAELGSVRLLRTDLDAKGIVSKRRGRSNGEHTGGKPFSRGALYALLQNQLYRGNIPHKGEIYKGQHEAIVDEALWEKVQQRLQENRKACSLQTDAKQPSLLAGKLVDCQGNRMTPTHAVKAGRRYRYYVTTALITDPGKASSQGQRIPAGDVEAIVLDRLRQFFASSGEISAMLASFELDAAALETALAKANAHAENWASKPTAELHALTQTVLKQVALTDDQIAIQLGRAGVLSALVPDARITAKPNENSKDAYGDYTLTVKTRLRQIGKGKRLFAGEMTARKPDQNLIQLVAQSLSIREQFLSGSDDSIEAMTRRLGANRGRLAMLMRLSYLSPAIVRAILAGRQPAELSATRLLKAANHLPLQWEEQAKHLGFAAR